MWQGKFRAWGRGGGAERRRGAGRRGRRGAPAGGAGGAGRGGGGRVWILGLKVRVKGLGVGVMFFLRFMVQASGFEGSRFGV